MARDDTNIVTLSKSSYDRASMLLNRILATITIENDSDTLYINEQTVLAVLEILYPDTYKKKVSALKTLRAKNFLKEAEKHK